MELAVLGWSQHQIAADLGISQAAVSKMLRRIEGRILRELAETVERQKARHTLRLEHLFAEAMRAWEGSKADTTRKRQRKTQAGSGDSGATVAEVVIESQRGDPRFLDEARKALADHRKLWGLDAPQRMDLRTPRNPYDGMTEEALRDLLARQSALLSEASGVSGDPVPSDEVRNADTGAEPRSIASPDMEPTDGH